jgi:hypothetical protein
MDGSTEELRWLLRGCFLPGTAGLDALNEWLARSNIERLDNASRRLLPFLYMRLKEERLDHPILPTLITFMRSTFYHNKMLFYHSERAVKILREAGVETMALKGLALSQEIYRSDVIRPMADIDLLVPFEQAKHAFDILIRAGWTPMEDWRSSQSNRTKLIRYYHSWNLRGPSGCNIDLHWNLTSFMRGPGADADFWAASSYIRLGGQTLRVLSAPDQFLHVCVHGIVPEASYMNIRWIPDALAILRNTPDFDWRRLVLQSQKCEVSKILLGCLNHLASEFNVAVPHWVLTELFRVRRSFLEEAEYRVFSSEPNSHLKFFFTAFVLWRARRGFHSSKLIPFLFESAGFRFGIRDPRKIPGFVTKKLFRRAVLVAITAYRSRR